jgi:hypothetical protein
VPVPGLDDLVDPVFVICLLIACLFTSGRTPVGHDSSVDSARLATITLQVRTLRRRLQPTPVGQEREWSSGRATRGVVAVV